VETSHGGVAADVAGRQRFANAKLLTPVIPVRLAVGVQQGRFVASTSYLPCIAGNAAIYRIARS
jgi:hypothetical protein